MVWDNDIPEDNRKWDLAAGLIRDNWAALEVALGVDLANANVTGSRSVIDITNTAYGALGDGSDDTTKIQAAIDAMSAGDTLFIPRGTYAYTNLIFADNDITILGEGKGSILKQQAAMASAGTAILISGLSGVTIRDFVLDGNSQNQTEELKQLVINAASDGVTIDNVTIKNALGIGLDMQGASTNINISNSFFTNCKYNAWTASTASNIRISNCKFTESLNDGLFFVHATNVKVVNCESSNNTRNGFTCAGNSTDIEFTNCNAYDNTEDGFGIVDDDITLTNCIAKRNGSHGFNPSTDSTGIKIIGCTGTENTLNGVAINSATNITVTGGDFSNNDVDGIAAVTSSDLRLTNNRCDSNGQRGIITTTTCSDVHVLGNRCYNNNQDASIHVGIHLDATTDFVVQGNICNDTQGTATQFRGIRTTSTCSEGIIKDNIAKDNTETQYLFQGTNCITKDNMDTSEIYTPSLADGATPSVVGSDIFIVGNTTTITNLIDGFKGKQVILLCTSAGITITDNANIVLSGSTNFDMDSGDTLTLIQRSSEIWYELSRGDNNP